MSEAEFLRLITLAYMHGGLWATFERGMLDDDPVDLKTLLAAMAEQYHIHQEK